MDRVFRFLSKYAVVLLFMVYAITGLVCFNDYGCGPDEGMERQTSLVNFRYAVNKLHLPISEASQEWLTWLPELHEYRDRYYGTALHLPLVLIENAFEFTLEPIEFYSLRHFYTFLNYFLSMICFYKLLLERFRRRSYAIIGVLMMILSPRFFAESFYNNKDVLFVAWYIISIYFSWRWLKNKSIKNAMLAGIILALTCNTRFNAIVFYPLLAFFWIIDMFLNKRSKKDVISFFLLITVTLFTFYIFTPNFWEHPLKTLVETFAFNAHHPNHGSDGNLFFGQLVDAAKTWYYVPVWIILTTPVLYLLLSLTGIIRMLITVLSKKLRSFVENDERMDIVFFCIGFLPVCAIILMHVVIYNGWRHCYFAYPSIIYFAVLGFSFILERCEGISFRKAVPLKIVNWMILGVVFLSNTVWIVENHPYEFDYFSPLFRNRASLFSGDYWGISSRDLLRYIVDTDPERMISINILNTQAGSINRGLLTPDQRGYIDMTYETEGVDYYMVCRDDKTMESVSLPGYQKVYSIEVDQDEIGAVFKKEQAQTSE